MLISALIMVNYEVFSRYYEYDVDLSQRIAVGTVVRHSHSGNRWQAPAELHYYQASSRAILLDFVNKFLKKFKFCLLLGVVYIHVG